jgi:hypothetical protein
VVFSWHQVGMLTHNQSFWHYFLSILSALSPCKMLWSSTMVSRTTGHSINDILISRASFHISFCQTWYFTNAFWQHDNIWYNIYMSVSFFLFICTYNVWVISPPFPPHPPLTTPCLCLYVCVCIFILTFPNRD